MTGRKRHSLFVLPLVIALALAIAWSPSSEPAQAADRTSVEVAADAQNVMQKYCIDCHGEKNQKGNIRLDQLDAIDTVPKQALFTQLQDVIHFEEMPPAKSKQPSAAERKVLLEWLGSQLTGEDAKKLAEKLRQPGAGNYVNHEDLFSGEYANLPGYTEDRRWLISEFIFDAKFNRILSHRTHFEIDEKRQYVIGSNNRRVNLTNPFLLPSHSGVRYYANETLHGGHLLTMLTNAKEASDYMMYLAGRDRRYLPAINHIMALEQQHDQTLASRERFLSNFIDRLLIDVHRQDHAALLPKFVPVDVQVGDATADSDVKKAPFHAANPGRDELLIIFNSMRKHEKQGQTDQQLIALCEKDWFYFGHHERKIAARVTFLNNYMQEWRQQIEQHRYAEKNRPVEYREPSVEEMEAIRRALLKNRSKGDRYNTIIAKCMEQWRQEFERERTDAGPPGAQQIKPLIKELFVKIFERQPTTDETEKYTGLMRSYIENLGNDAAIRKLIQTLILRTEFVYRSEFGAGQPDTHGRRMMSPREASYALAYALTDSSPDAELVEAVKQGRLQTREDYEREVRRMLSKRDVYYIVDESVNNRNDVASFTNMPIRELRFFREFFGYPRMLPIFKDNKRFGANYDNAKRRLVAEADRLVEHVVEQDQDVFTQLLTTDQFYVFHSGNNQAMQASSDRIRKIYDYFKDKDWQNFEPEDLARHKDFIAEVKMRGIDVNRLNKDRRYNPLNAFKTQMESFTLRLDKGQAAAAPYNSFPAHGMANAPSRYNGRLQSPEVAKFFSIDMSHWDYDPIQPTTIPNRKGMLTHPAWLIAFAQNTETDPIHRGKWIQEKLLAGTIPDVPITVDAVIPEDPHRTLRQRMIRKTGNEYCWTCHHKMEPLGLPFEMYDDFGRYRTEERLEYPENLIKKVKDKGAPHEDLRDVYKTLPVDSTGKLEGTGDSSLDGDVRNAIDLIDRLAQSDRVRQSIIRHAFRYFMGRNETLSDSKTMIDADKAYLESGGSFDAVIVSLLTSDSFIYRKKRED